MAFHQQSALPADPSLARLFDAGPFVRRNFKAAMYVPYSSKAGRRLTLYTEHSYDLWVHLESSSAVRLLNERVPPVPVVLSGREAKNISPKAVSLDASGVVTVHIFESFKDLIDDEELKDAFDAADVAWDEWCTQNNCVLRRWTPESLGKRTPRLTNLKQLLRFTSRPEGSGDVALQQRMLAELRSVRRLTWAALALQFPSFGRSVVDETIAALIVSEQVKSDIDRFPLSLCTEVSAYEIN